MATAEFNPTINTAEGTLGKRKKRTYPTKRLDLSIQHFEHSAKLIQKPKPSKKKTLMQGAQRERFREADCIYYRMTKEQRITIWLWAQHTSKTSKDKISSYNAFMQAALKNYMPDLLQEYFCTTITDPTASIGEDKVTVSSSVIYEPAIFDFESWFERIMRRT